MLSNNDEFFVLEDFDSYAKTQAELDNRYKDKEKWIKMSIQNIAHAGIFSSDRTICQYAEEIWKTKPVEIIERVVEKKITNKIQNKGTKNR